MKVVLGADVDPRFPPPLEREGHRDGWFTLDEIPSLVDSLADELPPITWLIRSDESVRHFTGDYASGYLSSVSLWNELLGRDHELGWHMHLVRMQGDTQVFDPEPAWLVDAHRALAVHFPVRSTRTGWDYASNWLLGRLDELGVELDFSALPGCRIWRTLGQRRFVVDWLRCPSVAYRPSRRDYQTPGKDCLRLTELPVTQFPSTLPETLKRVVVRARHGCFSPRGLRTRTRLLTESWPSPPVFRGGIGVFFFHPEDLQGRGLRSFRDNVAWLRRQEGVRFLTAGEAVRECLAGGSATED